MKYLIVIFFLSPCLLSAAPEASNAPVSDTEGVILMHENSGPEMPIVEVEMIGPADKKLSASLKATISALDKVGVDEGERRIIADAFQAFTIAQRENRINKKVLMPYVSISLGAGASSVFVRFLKLIIPSLNFKKDGFYLMHQLGFSFYTRIKNGRKVLVFDINHDRERAIRKVFTYILKASPYLGFSRIYETVEDNNSRTFRYKVYYLSVGGNFMIAKNHLSYSYAGGLPIIFASAGSVFSASGRRAVIFRKEWELKAWVENVFFTDIQWPFSKRTCSSIFN